MCGITGKIYFSNNIVSRQDILTMNDKIIYRGPDDGGVYISPDRKVGLGHRRLSVIDLSSFGHQPMSYLKRYQIVFNGEIYNFKEKKIELQKEGYSFRSKSDTEVILALYDKYKEKCLEHLRGMFSLVIYDEKENTIFCARDRVGKKPFKYYLDENVFIFASELKAILTQKEYKKELDYVAIHHYLTLQYIPAPLTGFKNIKKLEPAHYLKINLDTKEIKKERYWKLDYSQKLYLSENEWKKRILEKLEESVKLRMISDVPLGAFLSGGIDSSAIVAMMSKLSSKPIKTFSVGFKENKYNELPYARIIANKFKTDHVEFIVEPNAIEILPMLVRQFEEPFADSSALPTYYVSKMTRGYVTVALNGDGGDENFGGYGSFSVFKFSLKYEKIKILNNLLILPLIKVVSNLFKKDIFDKIFRFSRSIDLDYKERYTDYTQYFPNDQKFSIYTGKFKREIGKNNNTYKIMAGKFEESMAKNKMDQLFYQHFNTYLPNDLMAKVDMSSMLVSLESRSPFLDNEFIELCAKIPANLKIKGFNSKKYILKKSLEGLVPKEILYRKKMGFCLPIDNWFRKDLKQYIFDKLLNGKIIKSELFKKDVIKNMLEEHCNTKINHSFKIWSLLTLELWFEEYFNK